MNTIPDVWRILEVGAPESRHCRVLAGWYGGYLGADSWKLSSGITKIVKTRNSYLFENHSGSIYECYMNAHRYSMYTQEIYEQLCDEAKTAGMIITLLEEEDIPSKIILPT